MTWATHHAPEHSMTCQSAMQLARIRRRPARVPDTEKSVALLDPESCAPGSFRFFALASYLIVINAFVTTIDQL
jgi:hypothetical protein